MHSFLKSLLQQCILKPTRIFVPYSQNAKDKGTEGRCEESTPVVPYRKVGGGDLNAEQDT